MQIKANLEGELKERHGLSGAAMPLVQFYQELKKSGVTDIKEIAQKTFEHQKEQERLGLASTGGFTKLGSNSVAEILGAFDDSGRDCIFWCANHYLGLNRNKRVIEKTREAISLYGTGSGTSGMSGGMCSLHKEIEGRIKELTGKEDVLLFPTGYSTNLGCLSVLPGDNDVVIFDRECHASMIDGVRFSNKKWIPFAHNNVDDLEKKLERLSKVHENVFVVVEAAYSMSGDLCPLREICELKKKYGFLLYVDEAHTFGIYGKDGAGYCNELGIVSDVDFLMSTLSKATASIGGFLATDAKYIPYLRYRADSYIFQACISPGDAATILASLDEIRDNPEIVEDLHEKNRYMRSRLEEIGFDLRNSKSPIIPIYIADAATLLAFNRELFAMGIFSVSVVYPAVKPKEGRIRFIVNASHTMEHIDKTVQALNVLGQKYQLV
jgi:glycine C-acetyltransferase